MTSLPHILQQKIATSGPLSVSAYMQACLLDEAHGYYATTPVFGAEGDFITAPEISQLFGEMLGAFHAHLHQLFGAPDNAIRFEAGPGRGTLARDMSRTYQAIAPALYEAPCYLLEASASLRATQKDALAPQEPHFITDISAMPQRPVFGVANEFFDALGVDQAIFHEGAWHQRLIDHDNGNFHFVIGDKVPDNTSFFFPETANEGDIIESSPLGEALMAQLSHHIAHYGGGILIIDYGKTDNHTDTLQAVRDHKPCDVLSYQGEADITHWVDFARLATIASDHKARLIGPISQGRFLQDLGIGARAEALRNPQKPELDRTLLAAIDRLVSPAQMGQAFKVCLLIPEGEGFPPGFTSLA